MDTEERDERGSGRSQNVVHTLPRSMASVSGFLTGPLERLDPAAGATQVLVITADPETAVARMRWARGVAGEVLAAAGPEQDGRRRRPGLRVPGLRRWRLVRI